MPARIDLMMRSKYASPFALAVALLSASAVFCSAHPFLRKERDSR